MSRTLLASALIALLSTPLAAVAADKVSGSCSHEGKTLTFTDGVLYRAPDPFDDKQMVPMVVLTTLKLDKTAIAVAESHDSAIREQIWDADGAAQLQLDIREEGVTGMHFSSGGTSSSRSGSAFGNYKARVNDAQRIAAEFSNEAEGENELDCKLSFDLAYDTLDKAKAAAPKGKPLPVGGGEAGRVFMQNFEAIRKGDVDAMIATSVKEQGDQIKQARSQPDFKEMLGFMQALTPKTLKVTGGQEFDDRAELSLEGTDSDGAKVTGKATLKKEGGAWKVGDTNFSTSSSG